MATKKEKLHWIDADEKEVRRIEKMAERKDKKGLERWLKNWNRDFTFYEKNHKNDWL